MWSQLSHESPQSAALYCWHWARGHFYDTTPPGSSPPPCRLSRSCYHCCVVCKLDDWVGDVCLPMDESGALCQRGLHILDPSIGHKGKIRQPPGAEGHAKQTRSLAPSFQVTCPSHLSPPIRPLTQTTCFCWKAIHGYGIALTQMFHFKMKAKQKTLISKFNKPYNPMHNDYFKSFTKNIYKKIHLICRCKVW